MMVVFLLVKDIKYPHSSLMPLEHCYSQLVSEGTKTAPDSAVTVIVSPGDTNISNGVKSIW